MDNNVRKPSSPFEGNLILNAVSVLLPTLGILLAIVYIFHWRPFGLMIIDISYLYLLLVFFLPLCFLWKRISSSASPGRVPWYDMVLIALSIATPLYFHFNTYGILFRGWTMGAPLVPTIFSVVLWGLMLEVGRRSGGNIFAAVLLFFSAYPLFSSIMPGFLHSPSFQFDHIAGFHAMSEDSLRGIPFRTFSSLVIGFMIFAVVLQFLGAGRLFTRLAGALVSGARAGDAKVAVVASAFFATLSGSSTANVMTTGPFTIPTMKRAGFPSHMAGGVEAAASSGGTLTPPIMGASAFIMSEFTGIPYPDVAIAAAVPAFLYFFVLFSQIDAYAARTKLETIPKSEKEPSVWPLLLDSFHIVLPFILLIYILFFLRLTAQAPFIATGVGILLGLLRKKTRLNLKAAVGLVQETGNVLSSLLCIMAPVGLIIGGLIITGVAYSLPHAIVSLAQGNLAIILILGALSAFILGMGITTSAVYIFLAIVLAPVLVTSGFSLLSSHLFVLYTAAWSAITPPVALAAFAAAGIAGASPMKTGVAAMKLGVAKYIVPIIFIYKPALLLQGDLTDAIWVIPTAVIGLLFISGALEGYFWKIGRLTWLSRVLLFGAGLLVALPWLTPGLIGIGVIVIVMLVSYLGRSVEPLSGIFTHRTAREETHKMPLKNI